MFIPTKTVSKSGIFANSPQCKCSTEHFSLVKLSGDALTGLPQHGKSSCHYIYSRSVNRCH